MPACSGSFHALLLGWRHLAEPTSSTEAAFQQQAPSGDLTFVQTPHSLQSTDVIHQQLTDDADQLTQSGVDMVEWWPDIQSDVEEIGVENLTQAQTSELDDTLGTSNVKVFNMPSDEVPTLTAGRAFDSSPWKGEDYISDYSSAFGVMIAGASRLLTAAHCFDSGDYIYNAGGTGRSSGKYIGLVGKRLTATGKTDAESIRARGADSIYLGPAHTSKKVTIAGKTNNPGGAGVFNDGAFSGRTGKLTIIAHNECIHPTGSRRECGIVHASGSLDEIANEEGDSGAPMIRNINGKIYAAGIDNASTTGNTVACKSNIPNPCFLDVYYSNVDSVLFQLHATLHTATLHTG